MKNYRILSATTVDQLAEYVEAAINDGWELYGVVFLTKKEGMVNQPILKITTSRPSRWTDCRAVGCNEPIVRDNYCLLHYRESEPEEIK